MSKTVLAPTEEDVLLEVAKEEKGVAGCLSEICNLRLCQSLL